MQLKEPEVLVTASPTRCPYCHVGVETQRENWVVCQACLARHHRDCWQGACGSCQATVFLSPQTDSYTREGGAQPRARGKSRETRRLSIRRAFREGASLYKRPGFGVLFLASAIVNVLTGASFFVLGGFLTAGMWLLCLRALRGGQPRLSELFSGPAERFVPLTVCFFLVSVIQLLGLAALVVPGVILSSLLAYSLPLVVERGLTAKEAMKESWRRVRAGGVGPHFVLSLLTLLLAFLVGAAGVIPFGGVLLGAALVPLATGAWASAYRQVIDGEDEVERDKI